MTTLTEAERDRVATLMADPRAIRLMESIARFRSRIIPAEIMDADEVHAAALFGLFDAARTFDESRGIKFTTHAQRRIVGSIIDELRRAGCRGINGGGRALFEREGQTVAVSSLNTPLGYEHREEGEFFGSLTFLDVLPAEELPVGWELESEDEVRSIAGRLDGWDRDVIRGRYLEAPCLRREVIARRIGRDRTRVSQIHTSAVEKLREQLFRMKHGTRVRREAV